MPRTAALEQSTEPVIFELRNRTCFENHNMNNLLGNGQRSKCFGANVPGAKKKALLPNPTTIVHWKRNHLGAKRQLFSHIGRKINWISNSFSRSIEYSCSVVLNLRDKKGHHTNTLSPFRALLSSCFMFCEHSGLLASF